MVIFSFNRSRWCRRAIALMICFLIAACSNPQPDLVLGEGARVLAFGDSLTYGVGAEEGLTYPGQLEALLGIEVISAGVSGETTSEGLKRLPDELDDHAPDLLVLLEGGNDILRNQSSKLIKSNLSQMIELSLDRGVPVVLIGVPEKKLFSSSAPFYAELAEQYDLAFDGQILSTLLRDSRFKSDPIHLNSAGYLKLAEAVQTLILSVADVAIAPN